MILKGQEQNVMISQAFTGSVFFFLVTIIVIDPIAEDLVTNSKRFLILESYTGVNFSSPSI
jgi:hypothetical protein